MKKQMASMTFHFHLSECLFYIFDVFFFSKKRVVVVLIFKMFLSSSFFFILFLFSFRFFLHFMIERVSSRVREFVSKKRT